jgi:hypothetical protein
MVRTNVAGASIYLNRQKFNQPTAEVYLTIPVPPEEYSVRVEKAGYKCDPTQVRIQVHAGTIERLTFRLFPIEPTPAAPPHQTGSNSDTGAGLPPPQPTPGNPMPPVVVPLPQQVPPEPDVAGEQREWENARASGQVSVIQEFLKKYPNSRYADQARQDVERLEAERLNWEQVNRKDPKALRAWAQKHPESRYSKQALSEAEKLEQATRLQQPTRPEQLTKLDQTQRLESDRQAIMKVVSLYKDAYARKDLPALMKIWPQIDKSHQRAIQKVFAGDRNISWELNTKGNPLITANRATIECVRIVKATDNRGKPLPTIQDPITIHLQLNNGAWVISAVE